MWTGTHLSVLGDGRGWAGVMARRHFMCEALPVLRSAGWKSIIIQIINKSIFEWPASRPGVKAPWERKWKEAGHMEFRMLRQQFSLAQELWGHPSFRKINSGPEVDKKPGSLPCGSNSLFEETCLKL